MRRPAVPLQGFDFVLLIIDVCELSTPSIRYLCSIAYVNRPSRLGAWEIECQYFHFKMNNVVFLHSALNEISWKEIGAALALTTMATSRVLRWRTVYKHDDMCDVIDCNIMRNIVRVFVWCSCRPSSFTRCFILIYCWIIDQGKQQGSVYDFYKTFDETS